jgi:hypothetical protein
MRGGERSQATGQEPLRLQRIHVLAEQKDAQEAEHGHYQEDETHE